MINPFDPDTYFSTGEWKTAVDSSKTHYERIGLYFGDTVSASDIQKSFQQRYDWWREVNKRYNFNPANTKTKETGPASKDAMEKLQESYALLSNSVKKAAYDKQLQEEEGKKIQDEFLKMVDVVLMDKVLTQEGRRILLNCADSLKIERSTALEIISNELQKMGIAIPSVRSTPLRKIFSNYYKILEIPHTATNAEIEEAYEKHFVLWSRVALNPKYKEIVRHRKKLLQDALYTLLDQERRKEYDQKLKVDYGVTVAEPPWQKKNFRPILIGTIGIGCIVLALAATISIGLHRKKTFYPAHALPKRVFRERSEKVLPDEREFMAGQGWLGIAFQEMDPVLAEAFHVSVMEGVLINDVEEDSPAKKAGFQCGDIVIYYDGKSVRHTNHLSHIVEQSPAGKTVTVIVMRDGKEKQLSITVRGKGGDPFHQNRSQCHMTGNSG
ncbi:MAG: PDZ domain-containing protein [Candidatus Brocadiaceae bacterium]|nr:PDZ domain-containing protein [Candidatus Brocadiaceae bacterium]